MADFAAGQNSYNQSSTATTNYSISSFLKAGWNSNKLGFSLHSFLDFDLSSIPSGAVLGTPILMLYVIYNYGHTQIPEVPAELRLHRVTVDWTEALMTWIARGVPYIDWLTPGGDFKTYGGISPELSDFEIAGVEWQSVSGDALTSYVNYAIEYESGALRLGITPRVASGPSMFIEAVSARHAVSSFHPYLIVPYATPGSRRVCFNYTRKSRIGGSQVVTFDCDEQ